MNYRLLPLLFMLCFFEPGHTGLSVERSPASIKKQRLNLKKNKRKQRRQHLVLQLIRSTRTRYHAISALTKSMSREDKKSFKNLASSGRVDLRKPLKINEIKNLDFSLGNNQLNLKWNSSEKAYSLYGKIIRYDKSQSVADNFRLLKKQITKGSAQWIELFIPKAYAQNLDEVVYDLNYLLYVRSIDDEQQLINELGSDYTFKAMEKMERLVQSNQFLRMECNYGAHSMEARIILGDGSPANQVALVAVDRGQGSIEYQVERNGGIENMGLSESAAPLLEQNIFNEVCLNMSGPELEQYSGDLYLYGGQGSSQ